MKKLALLLIFIPFFEGAVGAFDFGVVLNQSAGVGGIGGDADFDYSALLVPWFSTPLGEKGDIFVSVGISAGYEDKEGFFAAELLRTEFSWRFNDAVRLRAGRLSYADPVGFVVDGLLDGAQVAYNTTIGTFSAAFMYSGLLYKKTTRITMSGEDVVSYYTALDYGDFGNTYFASRRLLAALGWEHPSLADLMRLKFALVGQFDLNDNDTPYHSQYASLKIGIPVQQLVFELGGALQMAQYAGKLSAAFAGELGASWALPLAFQSMISFNGRFSSGASESGSIDAFVPVTTMDHGSVLKARLSGLSVLALDYTARIRPGLSSSLAMTYFVRSDLATYSGYPVGYSADNKNYFLGGEFFGRAIWSPVSDLRLDLGGGVFLPALGNVAPDAKPQWRIELNLILSLY